MFQRAYPHSRQSWSSAPSISTLVRSVIHIQRRSHLQRSMINFTERVAELVKLSFESYSAFTYRGCITVPCNNRRRARLRVSLPLRRGMQPACSPPSVQPLRPGAKGFRRITLGKLISFPRQDSRPRPIEPRQFFIENAFTAYLVFAARRRK